MITSKYDMPLFRRLLERCRGKIEELLNDHDILSIDDLKSECDSLCKRVEQLSNLFNAGSGTYPFVAEEETAFPLGAYDYWFVDEEKKTLFRSRVRNAHTLIVARNKKSLWDVVRVILIEQDILKSDVTRETFSSIIETYCPKAGKARQIKQNAAKYCQPHDVRLRDLDQFRKIFER